jgi:hypothetical protein
LANPQAHLPPLKLSSPPSPHATLHRGWKHPCLIDTWPSLGAALEDLPHCRRFKRVWIGDVAYDHRGSFRTVVDRARVKHMEPADPSIADTAKLIVERRQRGPGVRPAAALWPRILDDVRALNLDQRTETDLARACYALLFVVPIAD